MAKNIVVCCDGTGNEYGSNNTNVVKLYEAIVRDRDQAAFYDPGVGTFSFLGRTLGRRVGRTLGKAFGAGLQQNIEDAYRFLMDRYEPGDRLYLFGFSRGAFTVRALAGMLNLCGLLQRGSLNLVPYASRIYNDRARHGMAPGFKRTYCHDCRPHLIGVWDTVGSMGWFWGRKFFDSTLNHDVKYGYHAVSIDEQRKKFPANMWSEDARADHQTIEQVWFAGVHSDVGGWYTDAGLSDIALEWMLNRAEARGLRLRPDWRARLSPDPAGRLHVSRAGFWRLWRPAPRTIPEGARIHRSVLARMDDPALGYAPGNLPGRYEVVE
ncbi:MAG: DUF2235 domain-containing protein [Acidobacteriia bacterium]|nr:DUF2235 domain-containing protein [Terriglobia bacterium]